MSVTPPIARRQLATNPHCTQNLHLWVKTCNGLLTTGEKLSLRCSLTIRLFAIAASRTRLWLPSGWGHLGRRLSTMGEKIDLLGFGLLQKYNIGVGVPA